MEGSDKKALNMAMPRLTSEIKLTTTFKALLVGENIFPDDVLDQIFEIEGDDEAMLKLMQQLKRLDGNALDKFIEVLEKSEHSDIAHLLNRFRGKTNVERQERSLSRVRPTDRSPPENPDATGPSAGAIESKRRSSPGLSRIVSRDSSVEEIRQCLRQMGQNYRERSRSEGDIVVLGSYFNTVRRFEDGKEDELPGPFQNLDTERTQCFRRDSFWLIPTEYSALICKLLGGKPTMRYTKHRQSVPGFVSLGGNLKFIHLDIGLMSSRKVIGSFYVSWEGLMHDCIAAGLGYYPTKVCYIKEPEKEIGLDMTVQDWFNSARKAGVYITV